MRRIYLDMNIYNRPFDDQSQVRIKLETVAINAVLKMLKNHKFSLLWSFMLEFENSLNPYDDIKTEIEIVSRLASEYIAIADQLCPVTKLHNL